MQKRKPFPHVANSKHGNTFSFGHKIALFAFSLARLLPLRHEQHVAEVRMLLASSLPLRPLFGIFAASLA